MGVLNRYAGALLLFLFIVFLVYLFKMSQEDNNEDENGEKATISNIWLMVVSILGGLAALVYGSDLTVNSAIDIAHKLNISDRIIGLTIIAIGTSLPELVTCIIAALKKQPDIAVGNIIGSNIFNILLVLGATCTISPIMFDKAFIFDGIVAIASTVLLFAFTCLDRKLTRIEGLFLLISYIGYLLYLIVK